MGDQMATYQMVLEICGELARENRAICARPQGTLRISCLQLSFITASFAMCTDFIF
jgi:hypothetical protein